MACLPESGACERRCTDPFVQHLNNNHRRHFVFGACLDQVDRNNPQPEVRYVDSENGEELVVERKSVLWPRDYAQRHKNDHLVADVLFCEIGELTEHGPYSVVLEAGLVGRPTELTAWAHEISNSVKAALSETPTVTTIGSSGHTRQWRFHRDLPEDREDDNLPGVGLVVRWYPKRNADVTLAPPGKLREDVSRLLKSCARKFENYESARKILLLDPHGDLRYLPETWWSKFLSTFPATTAVPEIWLALHDWITEWDQGWIFRSVKSPLTSSETSS